MSTDTRTAGGFTLHVQTYPYGTDPTRAGIWGKPPPLRSTVTLGPIHDAKGAFANGMMVTPITGYVPATGSFVVADNTFPAVAELLIGDYRLLNNFDYAIGVGVNQTATNIAAAISRLPNFSASAVGATVTVRCFQQADEVVFKAIHHGAVVSFDTFTGNGFLTRGVPQAGAPVLTV